MPWQIHWWDHQIPSYSGQRKTNQLSSADGQRGHNINQKLIRVSASTHTILKFKMTKITQSIASSAVLRGHCHKTIKQRKPSLIRDEGDWTYRPFTSSLGDSFITTFLLHLWWSWGIRTKYSNFFKRLSLWVWKFLFLVSYCIGWEIGRKINVLHMRQLKVFNTNLGIMICVLFPSL